MSGRKSSFVTRTPNASRSARATFRTTQHDRSGA
jgi:hypothetical protein